MRLRQIFDECETDIQKKSKPSETQTSYAIENSWLGLRDDGKPTWLALVQMRKLCADVKSIILVNGELVSEITI